MSSLFDFFRRNEMSVFVRCVVQTNASKEEEEKKNDR
jgi:hypothetical protein